jgi:release factor glutamine methyltransferase
MTDATPTPTLRSPIYVSDALRQGANFLRDARIPGAALEARLLLAAALKLTPEALLIDTRRPVPTEGFAALLARRAARVPLAYLLGEREFWSLPIEVAPATLIPRPESETLIEAALTARHGLATTRILDLGTGTGCLLLASLWEFRDAWGIGVDRNPDAAALAARNAVRLGFADRAAMLCGNWADPLEGGFDLVLSNPPYVRSADVATLMPEVAENEPRSALDGGPDGLDAYRTLLPLLPRLLREGGTAVLELGAGQDAAVGALAAAAGLGWRTVPDLAGIPRALVAG